MSIPSKSSFGRSGSPLAPAAPRCSRWGGRARVACANPDRRTTIDVAIVALTTWAAGLAASGAVVAHWRLVGPGFLWLVAGVTLGVGVLAWGTGAGLLALVGSVAAGSGVALARRPGSASGALGVGAASFLGAAATVQGVLPALTGSLLLGSASGGLALGHWYLVDPRLPRWPLRRLAEAGLVGMVADGGYLVAAGAGVWSPGQAVMGWAFLALGLLTLVLLVAVWLSLREPSYSGVMAATGLAYLAVMTAFGAALVGRRLVGILGGSG